MTERFSPEYIDVASKSEAIQAHKRKVGWQVGDWVYYREEWLGGGIDEGITVLGDGEEGWPDEEEYAGLYWLPTLSDLLDMLVRCEDLFEIQLRYKQGGWYFYIVQGEEPTLVDPATASYVTDSWAKDPELAAARLLARVAGKEKSDEM